MEKTWSSSGAFSEDALCKELHELRRVGLGGFSQDRFPCLAEVVRRRAPSQPATITRGHVDALLQEANKRFEGGEYERAAAVLYGVAPDVRGFTPIRLRKIAAGIFYPESHKKAVDAFRQNHEKHIIEELATALFEGDQVEPALSGATVSGEDGAENRHDWRETLRNFWGLPTNPVIDVVCSEIPDEERASFASPDDRNYLRYAKFADLDSLVCVRVTLASLYPDSRVRDFSHAEYQSDAAPDALIVIGGPPWNSTFKNFQTSLPFHFESRALGEDDPLILHELPDLPLSPSWSADGTLLSDITLFARIHARSSTTVYLLAGCLAHGVLGASMCFLHGQEMAGNSSYINDKVGSEDFILVTETARVGPYARPPNLTTAGTLVLMTRSNPDDAFSIVESRFRHGS